MAPQTVSSALHTFRCLLTAAVLFAMVMQMSAHVPDHAPAASLLPFSKERPNQIEQAYLDAYQILTAEDRCGAFFGGSRSLIVLNSLVPQMRTATLEPSSLIRMSGPFTLFIDGDTGLTYRLFQSVRINLDGAFFRYSSAAGQVHVVPVGGMRPGTREARVVALLHELGHLIKNADGKWLLPDDGNNSALSSDNTERVADLCRGEIISTAAVSWTKQLAQLRPATSTDAL